MASSSNTTKIDPNSPTSLLFLLCRQILGKGKKSVPEGLLLTVMLVMDFTKIKRTD